MGLGALAAMSSAYASLTAKERSVLSMITTAGTSLGLKKASDSLDVPGLVEALRTGEGIPPWIGKFLDVTDRAMEMPYLWNPLMTQFRALLERREIEESTVHAMLPKVASLLQLEVDHYDDFEQQLRAFLVALSGRVKDSVPERQTLSAAALCPFCERTHVVHLPR